MRRRLVFSMLWLGLAAPAAWAQLGVNEHALPTHNALNHLGLERQWVASVPLAPGTERVVRISLSGLGVNEPRVGHAHSSLATAREFRGRPNSFPIPEGVKGLRIKFASGLLAGAEAPLTSYESANQAFHLGTPLPVPPSDGDEFEVTWQGGGSTNGLVNDRGVSPTTVEFRGRSRFSSVQGYYDGLLVKFTSGQLADKKEAQITSYDADTQTFKFMQPFDPPPSDGDSFQITDLRSTRTIATGKVVSLPMTPTSFLSAEPLSERSNYYTGSALVFIGGELAGQGRTIIDYDGGTGQFTFREPFKDLQGKTNKNVAPAEGDPFAIMGGMLFAQTNHGKFHVFDSRSGRYLWGANLGPDQAAAQPAQVSEDRVFATNGATLFCFDRRTGREIWRTQLDSLATSPTAADADRVMVGLQNGMVSCFANRDLMVDYSHMLPGSNLFNWKTESRVTSRPIFADHVCAFASEDGRIYVAQIEPNKLVHRFLTGGSISGSMGAVGNRTLLAGSEDGNLYAIDLYNGSTKWVFASGAPIKQEPLVTGNEIFVINSEGSLNALDPDVLMRRGNHSPHPPIESTVIEDGNVTSFVASTGPLSPERDFYLGSTLSFTKGEAAGQARVITGYDALTGTFAVSPPLAKAPKSGDHFWVYGGLRWPTASAGNSRLLSLSLKRVYLASPERDLVVVGRAQGRPLFSPRETYQRMGIDLRNFEFGLTNRYDDRLVFGSESGVLMSIHEKNLLLPVPLRDPKTELPFGVLPEMKASQPAPEGAPAEPGSENAPAEPGAGGP